MRRRLVVLRHAKSAYPSGVPDHDRPLAPRGIADAGAAGRWLRDHVGTPDHVTVSTARRARQTWTLAAAQLGITAHEVGSGDVAPGLTVEPRVYEAWVTTLLEIVHALPADAGTVVLVGHNPGCEALVDVLAGERDPEAALRLARKYPTAGIAVLEHDHAWSDLAPGSASLTTFTVPRA